MQSKRTKYGGLPPTQQPREIPPEVIKKGLPTVTWHEKVPWLPITEGWRQIGDEPRPSIPRHKLIITKLLGLFKTVKVDELVQCDHVPINNDCPDHHTTYDDPPLIWHKLPWGYVQVIKEFHYEWMDREPKATQESSLIKAKFPMGKSTGLFTFLRETGFGSLGELKSIPKSEESILVQRTLLLESMERPDRRTGR